MAPYIQFTKSKNWTKKTYEHAHAHIPRDNLKRKTKINRLKMVLLFKIGEFKDNYITLF